jgi:hypothetical protein
MQSYLDAIRPDQSVGVVIGRRAQLVERARLGLHLRLARQAEAVESCLAARDVAGASTALRAYLGMAGVDTGAGTGAELAIVYRRLCAANRLQFALPFMRDEAPPREGPPLSYDYPGRGQAWWVHKLASRYGWSRDQVLGLWPEEAACYLQEILVAEFDEADERRSLSELAYHYDEHTRTSSFRPVPRPAWMVGERLRRRGRMPRVMLPTGNVIDLGGYGVMKRDVVH